LVTPTKLVDYIAHAVLIAIFLIVLARPIAVWCSLAISNYEWREKAFVSWVGLRGAVPIYLALLPALSGIEDGQQYFNVAFIIVLASLSIQGWTINPLARRLGLVEEPAATAVLTNP
jgi:cell volume regulation protein A